MSTADNISVMLSPGRNMRGVANLLTLDPDPGEPWGTNRHGEIADKSLIQRSMRQMLDTRTKHHGHFVLYTLEDADGTFDKCPRLTKDVLGQVREAGADVRNWGIGIDIDLKDIPFLRDDPSVPRGPDGKKIHWESLTPEQKTAVRGLAEQVSDALEAEGMPANVFYNTPHGMRFIHVFPESIPAGPGFENAATKLRARYLAHGLPADNACKDWTRFFAVPRCTHDDGMRTWKENWFEEPLEQWDNFYAPDAEDMAEVPEPVLHVEALDVEYPDPDDARAMVEVPTDNGEWQFTEKAKAARRELKLDPPVRCFDAVFNHAPLATSGNRHTTLLESVGQVVNRIYGFQWASPELAYALLLPAADMLGVDDDGTVFADKLREMVSSIWSKEDAKAAVRPEQKARAAQERQAILEERAQELPAIVATPDERFHVRTGDGYDPLGVPRGRIACRVQELRAEPYVEIFRRDKDGVPTSSILKPQEIVDQNTIASVAEVRGYVDHEGGGRCYLENRGRQDAMLRVPMRAARRDLPPLSPEDTAIVENYLKAAIPDRRMREYYKDCLAALLEEERPTAAISITGRASTGKGMWGECVKQLFGDAADADSMTGNFQEDLARTGLVWVDEDHDLGRDHRRGFATAFRKLVGGSRQTIQRKYRSNLHIDRAYRVLFTANDDGLLHVLLPEERQHATAEGLAATGMRISRHRFAAGAAEWLQARKGWDYTNKPGAEWVGGDPNNGGMILPRYVSDLWRMHKDGRRPITHVDPRGRFLVRGMDMAAEGLDLLIRRGDAPEVVQAILRELDPVKRKRRALHVDEDGELWAHAEGLASEMGDDRRKFRPRDVASYLRHLSPDDKSKGREFGPRQVRWWRIDRDRLRKAGELLDLDVDHLDKVTPAKPMEEQVTS